MPQPRLLILSLLSLPVLACGAVVDSDPGGGDSSGDCSLAAEYPAGDLAGATASRDTAGGYYALSGALHHPTQPAELRIELYPDTGVFAGAVEPGEYELAGAETDLASCGACVLVFDDSGGSDAAYMAVNGTLILDQVSPVLSGSVEDVTLLHVHVDEQGAQTEHEDGCDTYLETVGFQADVIE